MSPDACFRDGRGINGGGRGGPAVIFRRRAAHREGGEERERVENYHEPKHVDIRKKPHIDISIRK